MSASQSPSSSASPKPSSMTKEMLRNALIQHGVPLPDRSALKEELVRLYQEHVVPGLNRQGEFSSDDEQETSPFDPNSKYNTDGLRFDVDLDPEDIELYVSGLNDAELYSHLKYFGITCGPVVASTRNLYASQVEAALLSQRLSRTNGNNHVPEESNGRNGFSDSDDDAAVETASRASRSSRASGVMSSQNSNSSRRRQVKVSSSRNVSVTTSTSQPDVNTSTGHLVVEPDERKNRRSLARNTPPAELTPDGGGGGEGVRPIPAAQQLPTMPRFVNMAVSPNESPSTISRRSREPGTVSYFRERPGYASTTTSTVLPRKPTVNREEEKPAEPSRFQTCLQTMTATSRQYAAHVGALCAIIIAILVVMKLSTVMDTVTDSGVDELDDVLAELEKEEMLHQQ